jgi:hypothetical protein
MAGSIQNIELNWLGVNYIEAPSCCGENPGNIIDMCEGYMRFYDGADFVEVNSQEVWMEGPNSSITKILAGDLSMSRNNGSESLRLNVNQGSNDAVLALDGSENARIRIRKNGTDKIMIDTEDFKEEDDSAKLMEYYVVINGSLRKAVFLSSEVPYVP